MSEEVLPNYYQLDSETIKNFPHMSDSKIPKPLDTTDNLKFLLDFFYIEVKYNLMSRRREIRIPCEHFLEDEKDNSSLMKISNIATLNNFPISRLDDHLNMLAWDHAYHPVVKALADNPWDKVNRLESFLNTLKTTQPEIDRALIKTWMVAAIAAAHCDHGFENHGVLVLQGAQGVGKTRWIEKLDPLGGITVKSGYILDPKNKDSIIGINRFWITELGELDGTFNKSDIAALKSFISSPVDDIRLPYARAETRLLRRSAYIATVNEPRFLVDTTGNRRWWTVEVLEIDYQHKFNMMQIWSEIYAIWKNGAITYLDNELQEKLNLSNKEHEKIDPIAEKMMTAYDWRVTTRRQLTVTAILEEIGFLKPTQMECIRAGRILTEINKKSSKKSNGLKVHDVPPRLIITHY